MNPTPSQPERPEHNPDGLTPEQYGAPEWRLLLITEYVTEGDEYSPAGCPKIWSKTSRVGAQVDHQTYTYRRRVATRTAPEAVAGEPFEVQSTERGDQRKIICHSPGMRCEGCDHYKGLADVCVFAPTPPEADKDAEIARLREERDFWRRAVQGATEERLAAKVEQSESYLTTARATIAERDKRIETLVGALEALDSEDLLACLEIRSDIPGGVCECAGCKGRKALAHAAEGKEQA